MLWIDTRYEGDHGIARYAREVIKRIDLPWHPLPVSGDPTSPRSAFHRGWRVPAHDDLIYSPGFGTGRTRARQLLTVHDLIHFGTTGVKSLAQRSYYEYLVRPALKNAGHVMTVSPTSASALQCWLKNDSIEVHISGNGCSERFTKGGPIFNHHRPYVIWVGNAKAHKNAQTVMATMSLLPEFDLFVVAPESRRIHEMILDANIESRSAVVSHLGDDDLAAYYRGAHALLYPSLLEGFGLPALEALSCGTSVVYFAGCEAVAEIVGSNGSGVASPYDAEAYAEAVRTVNVSVEAKPASWDEVASRVCSAIASFSPDGFRG